jgi:hypothetical protein
MMRLLHDKDVSFGQSGASDYTVHQNFKRKQRYIARHSQEYKTKPNIDSLAWLPRIILLEKPESRG